MTNDYGMFTRAGNDAVGGVVDELTAAAEVIDGVRSVRRDHLYAALSTCGHPEATDTAVRDAVFGELRQRGVEVE